MSKSTQEQNDLENSYQTLWNEYDKVSEVYDILNSCYFDLIDHFMIKHNGEPSENTFEMIYEWLLEKDYELTLRSPIDALKRYANEYYNKFVR
jgi:hypothetical protein